MSLGAVPSILHNCLQVYPQIYNWVTFPLVSLIEKVYSQCTTDIEAVPAKSPDPCLVELCSVAERALNYMHTGNAAVISTTVMNPLWIGNAVVHDGLPCFNRNIVSLHANSQLQVSIIKERWPYNETKLQPKTSSSAAQIFAYDIGHFNVSISAPENIPVLRSADIFCLFLSLYCANILRFAALQSVDIFCLYTHCIPQTFRTLQCPDRRTFFVIVLCKHSVVRSVAIGGHFLSLYSLYSANIPHIAVS